MIRSLFVFLAAFSALSASAATCEIRKHTGDTLEIIPIENVDQQDDQGVGFKVTPIDANRGFIFFEARTGIDSFADYVVVVNSKGESLGCKQNTILKSGTYIGAEARCSDVTIECAAR